MSTLSFDGDVVIVTGAGGGMGRCHALELARRGARVVVNDLGGHPLGGGSDPSLAEAVVDEIRAFGGEAVANTQSVATPEGGASVTETAMKQWGRLDAVVSNAAIVRDIPFEDMTFEDFDDLIDVNLRGGIFVLHPAYKAMKASGGGRILAVTSTSGLLGAHSEANYAAAKAGLVGLVRSIAIEGAPHGIKANLLAPGALGTRMHLAVLEAGGFESEDRAGMDDLVLNPKVMERMTPEKVSPIVIVLTHRTCPCTSQILNAQAGQYGRSTVTINRGWIDYTGTATAEDVVAHWDEIIDQSTAEDPEPDTFAYAARNFTNIFG
jgi:NAD(P)-dependent dehydrogenase (short-subunit alcohol dehydrogenase family)